MSGLIKAKGVVVVGSASLLGFRNARSGLRNCHNTCMVKHRSTSRLS